MTTEYATWIEGPAGRLFAIIHEPAPARIARATIIMLNAGQDSRVGPQRLYVKAARSWAKRGFSVMRVDLSGTGDAEPDGSAIHLDSHSTKDVELVVRWARDHLGDAKLFLLGLCAGARVAIRYAVSDVDITGVLAWSCPTLSEGNTPYLNLQGATKALATRRILTTGWWRNRWKYGLTEVRQLVETSTNFMLHLAGFKNESVFLRSADKYLAADRPALFLYGELDKILCAEFFERFPQIESGIDHAQGYEVVPDAVHAFSSVDAHDAVIDLSARWIAGRLHAQSPSAEAAAPASSRAAAQSP